MAVKLKGTWTTASPNHLQTILGTVAIALIIAWGLISHASQSANPSPATSPTPIATPSQSHPTPAARPTGAPVRPRGS